jgi:hypothetical protein
MVLYKVVTTSIVTMLMTGMIIVKSLIFYDGSFMTDA